MTTKELREKIANAKNHNWFNNVEEKFDFPHVGVLIIKKGVSAIYEFVKQQVDGWNRFENKIPQELTESKNYFEGIANAISNFVNKNSDVEVGYLENGWRTIQRLIRSVNVRPFTYDSAQCLFLLQIYNKTPNYFSGAYNCILGDYSIDDSNSFYGTILAYEFTLKEKTEISSRVDKEQKSISELKAEFIKYIDKSEEETLNHIRLVNEKYIEGSKKIDELTETKKKAFDTWYDEKLAVLSKLEQTYESKLKLEKPARYWEKKSTKYFQQGRIAKNVLIGVVAFSAVFLGLILLLSPTWIFSNVFKGNEASLIKWSIVFLTLLSLIAYSIKSVSKYMFSSFHLARDAEERHTLTFFYLAILKDSKVSDSDRTMILQALFSRTDTGLLKEDSSPTMPSEIIKKNI